MATAKIEHIEIGRLCAAPLRNGAVSKLPPHRRVPLPHRKKGNQAVRVVCVPDDHDSAVTMTVVVVVCVLGT